MPNPPPPSSGPSTPFLVAESGYGYQGWYGRYRTPGGESDPEEIWMSDRLLVTHLLVTMEAAGGP